MEYIQTEEFKIEKPSALCIGKFEGLHIGHQSLIQKAKESGLTVVLLAFEMSQESNLFLPEEKRELAENFGVDIMVSYPFTERLKHMTPDVFIQEIILKQCRSKCVIVGEDFRFGFKRQGCADTLKQAGEFLGFEVDVMAKKRYQGEIVSSSLIRQSILGGDLEYANNMLGFPFCFSGEVVKGNQIGRTLQMPTANLIVRNGKMIPPKGVYASITHLDGKEYPGVTNIGTKPTVDDALVTGAETYLFDFDEDIYGKNIKVDLHQFIRPEKKFSGLNELRDNMFRDSEHARKALSHLTV